MVPGHSSLQFLGAAVAWPGEKLERRADQRPAKENNNNSQNDALVRHTRSLGRATWIIAGVGVLSFAAALLQWSALRNTDSATRDLADASVKQSAAAEKRVTAMQGQLDTMKSSLDISRDSADAARKAADVAERALLSQRAIVAVERFADFATTAKDQNNAVIAWTFRAYIKNTGGTEAINGHNHINLRLQKADLPDDFDYHYPFAVRQSTVAK
jgi:hypothetical protein